MRATTTYPAYAEPQFGPALRLWASTSALVVRVAARTALNGLLAITKARILSERGAHPLRGLRRF